MRRNSLIFIHIHTFVYIRTNKSHHNFADVFVLIAPLKLLTFPLSLNCYQQKIIVEKSKHRYMKQLLFFLSHFRFFPVVEAKLKSRNIDDITQTGTAIKQIFKKKKNASADTSSSDVVIANGNKISTQDDVTAKTNKRMSAGDIAPYAKYLDVDEMYYFSEGAAVVVKGSSTALIDSNGNFIVPFNKYQIEDATRWQTSSSPKYKHGIFHAIEISSGQEGLLNSKGKFIAVKNAYFANEINMSVIQVGMSIINCVYYDYNLNKYSMDKCLSDYRESVGVSFEGPVGSSRQKYGYKKLNGQFTIKPQFDFAKGFYEGRAIVGKLNEFGEMKYGFIDQTGKEIFPCVLSKEPSPFCSGRARIEPKDKTQFDYAYINQEGKVVIKCKLSDGDEYGDFSNGYAFSMYRVMDTMGKTMSRENFLKKFGVDSRYNFTNPYPQFITLDEIMSHKFSYQTSISPGNPYTLEGYFDVRTGKTIKPVFVSGKGRIRYDRVARRSYAATIIGKDKEHQTDIFREGYINEDGLFVIVKGSSSKW